MPELLGTTENELGLRSWLESQGHTLVTTSDKEGHNSKFDQELVDAEVIITTPYVLLADLACSAVVVPNRKESQSRDFSHFFPRSEGLLPK